VLATLTAMEQDEGTVAEGSGIGRSEQSFMTQRNRSTSLAESVGEGNGEVVQMAGHSCCHSIMR
jgi:hypothetical protein